MDDKITSKSGATSSKIPCFHLIPRQALVRLSERMELGAIKHGQDNWRKGLDDQQYIIERAGHVIDHAYKLIAKLKGELPQDGDDDAAAVLWGGMFLCEATSKSEEEHEGRDK